MKIIEKLALQKKLGGLLLFREGLFLKAYNQSCYILTQQLQQNLKIKCYQVRLLQKSWIVECGFQYSKLAERLPKAVITEFGAQLSGDFNMQGYNAWLEQYCHKANEVAEAAKAGGRPLQTGRPSASALENVDTVNSTSVLLPLSKQQLIYLQSWQKGRHPIEVEQGFIESLKQQVMPSI